MDHKTPKQHLSDEQKIKQLKYDIGQIKQQMDQEYIQKLNNKNDPIYNIFLLGPSGSGKSTMANELIDVRIVFQSDDDETFNCSSKQNKNMKFKISEESMRSETDMPQEYRVNQYQLWDLPGYFDCRCKYKDLKNIVSSQSLIQHSEYSQILIVIPASQFFDYKLDKLIKILNNIELSNCELSLSLVISMVNGQKLDYFLKKLNDLLKGNLLHTGRELLLKILVQNRVIIFECPKQDPKNEDIYYFCQENIKSIKAQVFQTNRFTKFHQLKLNPPDETKITLQDIYQQFITTIKQSQEILNKQNLKIIIQSLISNKDEQLQSLLSQTQRILTKDFGNVFDFAQQKNQDEQQIQNIFKDFDDITNMQIRKITFYIQNVSIQSHPNYQKYLSQFDGIDIIFICTLIVFNLDKDLILPGVSIYLNTYYFISEPNKKLSINLKGKDGQGLPKAGQSKTNPQDGEEGQIGNDGGNGGHLHIEAQQFDIDVHKLTINVSGGNGGKGQEGGDGIKGKNGNDGEKINDLNRKKHKILEQRELQQSVLENYGTFSNTYLRIYKSNGSPGLEGGNAGAGGLGGVGGKAGTIKIGQQLLIKKIIQDGEFGPNGQDGIPGEGGQIGRSFLRKYNIVKSFGALRQHENLKEDIRSRLKNRGVGTVASVFGTAVKSMLKTNEWLDEGEYQSENTFSKKGDFNKRINERSKKMKTNPQFQQKDVQEFVKTTQDKWNSNSWIQQIQQIQNELQQS
ncbi:hypothetical protein pb186bvf_001721 [Paramecium bursaria]